MNYSHKNEDKTPGADGRLSSLNVRLEVQIDRNWFPLAKSIPVYILTEPAPRAPGLRSATRWAEDWTSDSEWWSVPWVVCWIPNLNRKAQIRVLDISYE
jgi:hypothetical protein